MIDQSKYLQEFIRKNQFVHQGNWFLSIDGQVDFSPLFGKIKIHYVYIWLARKENQFIPLYIGKASKGIVERMNQHKGGFRHDKNGSVSGRRKRKIIEELIENNWSIEVYSKESRFTDNETFSKDLFEFDYSEYSSVELPRISLYSIEEELLIRFFELNFSNVVLMNGLKESDVTKILNQYK
jgi:hypothetical protein